ncbi:MAG: YkvA family protein [Lachnospiraceae bacterium]
MNIRDRLNNIKVQIPAVYLALKKNETPWYAKVLAGITIVYVLSPVDLVPDFIPVLGYLDDVVILPLLIAATRKLIPDSIMEECEREAKMIWQSGKPKRWYFAVPIVVIWLLILLAVIRLICRTAGISY